VARAREGDTAAAKLLFSYTLGKPTAAVDPDTLDVQEWQLYRQRPVAGQDLLRVLTHLPAEAACALLRAALPGVADGMLRLLADGLARQAQEEQEAAARPRRTRPAGGPAAAGAAGSAAPAGPAAEQPAAAEQGDGRAPGDGPAAAGQPAPGVAGQETTPPAAAVPHNVARIRERDTELQRELQALLCGLGSVEWASPGRAPTANGENGGADTALSAAGFRGLA
jgi:hypothetical protein